jgi:hypothetical protein
VLLGGGRPSPGAAERLREAVERCRALLSETAPLLTARAADYVDVLAAKLAAAGHPLSTRRAVALVGNVASLRAAQQALTDGEDLEDAFYAAARFSLPDAAWGRPVAGHVLLAAHRAAWEAARLAAGSPERALLAETDPLRRIALALTLDLPASEAGAVIADGFSALPRGERLVTSAVFFPRLAKRKDLPASTLETVAEAYAAVARGGRAHVTVRQGGRDWKRELLGTRLAQLDPDSARDRVLQNAAAVLMADDERFDLDALAAAWEKASAVLSRAGAAA